MTFHIYTHFYHRRIFTRNKRLKLLKIKVYQLDEKKLLGKGYDFSKAQIKCKGVRKPIMEVACNFLGWTLRCLLKIDSFISLVTYVNILNVLNFMIERKRFNFSPGFFLIKSIYKMVKYDFKSFSNTRFETINRLQDNSVSLWPTIMKIQSGLLNNY